MRTLLPLTLLLAVCASCETYDYEAERSASLDMPIAGVERLEAKTHNGSFTYRGAAPAQAFQITARLKAYGRTQAEADANLELLRVACDTTAGVMSLGADFRGEEGTPTSISFEIDGPASLGLDIETHNGAVAADGVQGAINLVTHNGSIKLEDVAGSVDAETHNGGVRLTGPLSSVRVLTHNGEITLENSATTVTGHLETHNGGIDVTLDPAASVAIEASTHNGSISVPAEANVRDRGEHRVEAVMGSGAGRLEAVTHNGRVAFRAGSTTR